MQLLRGSCSERLMDSNRLSWGKPCSLSWHPRDFLGFGTRPGPLRPVLEFEFVVLNLESGSCPAQIDATAPEPILGVIMLEENLNGP